MERMTEAESHECLWKIYQTTNEWVRFADVKAGLSLTAQIAVLTLVGSLTLKGSSELPRSPMLVSAIVLAGALSLVSIFFAFRCVVPRLAIAPRESLIYFSNIYDRYKTQEAFRDHALAYYSNQDVMNDHLLDQIWVNSTIALLKHKDCSRALQFLAIEIVLVATTLTCVLIYATYF